MGISPATPLSSITDIAVTYAGNYGTGGQAYDIEFKGALGRQDIGDITVDCDVLNDGESDLKLVVYTAASSEDATKLHLALVAGVH